MSCVIEKMRFSAMGILKRDKGFTLAELLVVLIIIGVLVALALPKFTRTREKALDTEAQTALRLIQAAQKIYRIKTNSYYPAGGGSADQAGLNSNLTLDVTSQSWQYGIRGATSSTFTANATRSSPMPSSWGRDWTITESGNPACADTDLGLDSCL